MPITKPALRVSATLGVAVLAASLCGCAARAVPEFSPPTMAPEQSLSEACGISGEAVDRLTLEVEQQIHDGLAQAGRDITAGLLPNFDFLAEAADTTLTEVEQQISNTEVLDALGEVRQALQGFGEIKKPESLLGAAGYLGALNAQLGELMESGKRLQHLCDSSPR